MDNELIGVLMDKCTYCGKSEGRILRGHTIPRFLDKSKSNRGAVRICYECEMERASREYSLYQSYAISENKEFYNIFLKSTFEIESLIEAKLIDAQIQNSMYRLLYSNVISTIETYLSDAFINIVMADPILIRKLVETSPEFKNQKFDLCDLYSKYEYIETMVGEYLVNIIYHNLSKVKNLYNTVLGIQFPHNLSPIYKAISIRHDIVHRNGKNKDGQVLTIEKSDVLTLLNNAREFIADINRHLPEIIRNENDL